MVERQLPKLDTRVRFPSPAHSPRAALRLHTRSTICITFEESRIPARDVLFYAFELSKMNSDFDTTRRREIVPKSSPPTQRANSRISVRLLVVEDHANSAEGLKKLLTRAGHEVFMANDMRSALRLAATVEFDVLLSDIALPDGNGWELMKILSATRRIEGIAFSGYSSEMNMRRSREVGFLEHLTKPLSADVLFAAIDRAALAKSEG